MKSPLILLITFAILSCSRNGSLFGSDEDYTPPPRLFSGVILAPAQANTSVLELVSANGTPMQIRPNDKFSVRFFDSNYKSHETEIGSVATVNDIFTAITTACNTFGTSATVVQDNNNSGSLILKTSGNPIISLVVENLSNSLSNAQVQKTFAWKAIQKSQTKSEGLCLTYAQPASPLRLLRDSSGRGLGLEPNDIIRVRGQNSQGPFQEEGGVKIDTTGTQFINDLFSLISSQIEESSPSFGNTSIPTEAGRVTITIPSDESASSLTVQLVAEERSDIEISPTFFNSTMVFK